MKLFVDDMRAAPKGWVRAHNYGEAIAYLSIDNVNELSLDHDLGNGLDGYAIARWMVTNNIWADDIYVHSMNPVGRHNILALLKHYAPAWVTVHGSEYIAD